MRLNSFISGLTRTPPFRWSNLSELCQNKFLCGFPVFLGHGAKNKSTWLQRLTLACPQWKINRFQNYCYLIHTWADKAFKGTVVNWVLSFLHWGSIEITRTVFLSSFFVTIIFKQNLNCIYKELIQAVSMSIVGSIYKPGISRQGIIESRFKKTWSDYSKILINYQLHIFYIIKLSAHIYRVSK